MGSEHGDDSTGFTQNPMFKNALQRFGRGRFTHAGRALTKHPNIVGAQNAAELVQRYENQDGLNKAAAATLKYIMRNGTRITKHTKAFGQVVEFKLPDGLGARFHAETHEFIGFLGRGI